MSKTMNNIDELFGMDILNETVIEESTIPKTDEGTGTPKLQETFPEVKIPVPEKTELTASVYNDALAKLKKLMNESSELMQTLVDVEVIQESIEDTQAKFTDQLLENAIMESYCVGPYFEAATKESKSDIQAAVEKIKKLVKSNGKDEYTLKPISLLSYLFARYPGVTSTGPQRKWIGVSKLNPIIWQMCGVFFCHPNEFNDAIDHYKTKFADELGELTFNGIECNITFGDIYGKRAKGADGAAHILLVDTKRDKETKKVDLPTKEEFKAATKEDKK